jgi:hypothetical protein
LTLFVPLPTFRRAACSSTLAPGFGEAPPAPPPPPSLSHLHQEPSNWRQ